MKPEHPLKKVKDRPSRPHTRSRTPCFERILFALLHRSSDPGAARRYIVQGLGLVLLPATTWAQSTTVPPLATTLASITQVLQSAGYAVVALALIWAGYKMVFQHARWTDIATIVLGSICIGASPSLATWLITGMGPTGDASQIPTQQDAATSPAGLRPSLSRGDIVRLNESGSSNGDATVTYHFALILSRHSPDNPGTMLVAPIAIGVLPPSGSKCAISLPANGTIAKGVVVANLVRAADVTALGATRVDTAPPEVVHAAVACLKGMVDSTGS